LGQNVFFFFFFHHLGERRAAFGCRRLLSFERLTSGAEGYALAELEERKMMVAAKELLEQTHGLSEEAASGSARWRRSCFKASAGN
jgi:hypothetical protein